MRACLFACLLWLVPGIVSAQVINEVMWPGSDMSTADEWIELLNPGNDPVDIGGWLLSFLDSSGAEKSILIFPSGTVLEPRSYFMIANDFASSSRLVAEADVITSAVSLPNSKLLLWLKDAAGEIIDTVDDGVGNPFAGSNATPKASMERIDPLVAGNVSSNWATAAMAVGFDDGAPLLGTPGSSNSVYVPPAPSSSSASSEESSSSSASSVQSSSSSSDSSSVSSEPLSSEAVTSSLSSSSAKATEDKSTSSTSSSSSSVCTDDLEIEIYVQSGELRALKKTTVNLEARAAKGTLQKDACHFTFGDGKASESCNPGPHAFEEVGMYSVLLEAKNQCGNTLKQELLIEVLPDPSSPSQSLSSSGNPYDGSRLRFSAAMPNPEGVDASREWIEIRNLEDHPVSLEGWTLGIGVETLKKIALHGRIEARQIRRIYSGEIPFSLTNTHAKVQLLDPYSLAQSLLVWKDAVEGRMYLPEDLRRTGVRGRILRLLDAQTIEVEIEGEARVLIPDGLLHIHLLGLTFPTLTEKNQDIFSAYFLSIENARALIENKNFELEFDSNVWSSSGILQGYAYIDGALSVAENLLLKGVSYVDLTCGCARLDQLKKIEESARAKKIGIWSALVNLSTPDSQVQSGPLEKKLSEKTMTQSVQISEIFSHPKSSNVASFSEEWIELKNSEQVPVILSGWTLQVGSKKRLLGSSFSIGSGGYLVVSMSDLKLQLRDSGNTVQLIDSYGRIVSSIDYPRLKAGVSFGPGLENVICELREPSPGAENVCIGPKLSRSESAKLAAKAKAATKVAKLSASYISELPLEPRILGVPEDRSSILPVLLGVFVGVASTFGLFKIKFF